MKRIILAFAFLILAFPATAQVNQLTILTPLTSSHRLPFNNSVTVEITTRLMDATRAVRLLCSVSCAVMTTPNAITPTAVHSITQAFSSLILAPLVPEYIAVEPNGRIAVIGVTNAGTLYVQEMGR